MLQWLIPSQALQIAGKKSEDTEKRLLTNALKAVCTKGYTESATSPYCAIHAHARPHSMHVSATCTQVQIPALQGMSQLSSTAFAYCLLFRT